LPGGFVEKCEDIEPAAKRELEEETCVKDIPLEQFGVFGRPGRDPRGRTVSAVYFAVVNHYLIKPVASDDAKEVGWFSQKSMPELAFDHSEVISKAVDTLRMRVENTPIVSSLLSPEFEMTQLVGLYEIILDRNLDDKRFKCEILRADFIEGIGADKYSFKKGVSFSSRFY
jgi:8-oxo-dGTP diphosphatase